MKPLKALVLGLLLLVPILVFIFISVFGTHHFSLRTYYPKLDEQGQIVYNAAGDTVFQTVPYFELITQEGSPLSQPDLDSTIYVVAYFDPACPVPCQELLSKMVRVQEAYENIPEVKLVTISTATNPDSLQTLQRLAATYGANPDRWYLLTGSPKQKAILTEALTQEAATPDTANWIENRLFLVDKEKQVRGIYKGAGTKEIDRLILEINVLLDEYSKRK